MVHLGRCCHCAGTNCMDCRRDTPDEILVILPTPITYGGSSTALTVTGAPVTSGGGGPTAPYTITVSSGVYADITGADGTLVFPRTTNPDRDDCSRCVWSHRLSEAVYYWRVGASDVVDSTDFLVSGVEADDSLTMSTAKTSLFGFVADQCFQVVLDPDDPAGWAAITASKTKHNSGSGMSLSVVRDTAGVWKDLARFRCQLSILSINTQTVELWQYRTLFGSHGMRSFSVSGSGGGMSLTWESEPIDCSDIRNKNDIELSIVTASLPTSLISQTGLVYPSTLTVRAA